MTGIAFVTPWYGANIPGGAEESARQTAEHLRRAGLPVEVLTTCIEDFHSDWGKNAHRPGVAEINGVPVTRFRVEKRDSIAFDQVNHRLIHNLPLTTAQERIYLEEMIRAPALYDHMRRHADSYLFVLIPYLFATTYHGLAVAPRRSLVIPCLHDESYARLPAIRQALASARALVFHAQAEAKLAHTLLGPGNDQLRKVIGLGVNTDANGDGDRFRQTYGLTGPLVLYAGRREPGKNTPLLLSYWQRYHRHSQKRATLVLLGSGEVSVPTASGIVDLGFVPAQDKLDAYAAASVFIMPSLHESFSIVIMESWLAGTPVLVHGDCPVTREHVVKSNGGLYFTNFAEFSATLDYLLQHPDVAGTLAAQGRAYVLANYGWPRIIKDYRRLFAKVLEQ